MTWELHHGDSLLWLPTLADESVDTLCTDPPYSSGGLHATTRRAGSVAKCINGDSGKMADYPEFFGDNRDQRSMLAWASLWLAECHRILRPGGIAMVFADWRQMPLMTDALQAGGFTWRGVIVWDKTEAARPLAADYPLHQCEYLVWGSKGQLPQRPPGTGLTIPGCLRHPVARDKDHPTEKPVGLLLDLLKIGRPGGVVLDPFLGSGTTGAAAIRSGMSFLGCEMSAEYHQRALERLRAEESGSTATGSRAGQLALPTADEVTS